MNLINSSKADLIQTRTSDYLYNETKYLRGWLVLSWATFSPIRLLFLTMFHDCFVCKYYSAIKYVQTNKQTKYLKNKFSWIWF